MAKIVKSNNVWFAVLEKNFQKPEINPQLSLPENAENVIKAIEKHILTSLFVKSFIKSLPKGRNGFCPNSPIDELVKYAASQTGRIDQSDNLLNLRLAMEFTAPISYFKYEKFYSAIKDSVDFSTDELWILSYGLFLPRLINDLWSKWHQAMVIPYLLSTSKEQAKQRELFDRGLPEYDYTVFEVRENRIVKRQTWAQAWPRTIRGICEIYGYLSQDVENQALKEYFNAVRNAFLCRYVEEVEGFWKIVDEKWIKIGPEQRVFMTHGIEKSYEHPVCVSPEMQIVIRTDDYAETIQLMRQKAAKYADQLVEKEIVEASWAKSFGDNLANIDIGVFVSPIGTGYRLTKRHTGLLAPNRESVRQLGSKIFVEKLPSQQSIEEHYLRLKKYCTPETFVIAEKFLEAEFFAACTIGHELGHIFGLAKDTAAKLGSTMYLLEEAKATAIGSILAAGSEFPNKNLAAIAVKSLARVTAFLSKEVMERQGSAVYIRENLLIANIMLHSRILEITERGLKINFENFHALNFLGELQLFINSLLIAYHKGQADYLRYLADSDCCQIKPETQELINFINK